MSSIRPWIQTILVSRMDSLLFLLFISSWDLMRITKSTEYYHTYHLKWALNCHNFKVMMLFHDLISPPVDLLNNNCLIILYAVDTLGNNDCWVFVLLPPNNSHNYFCIYTKHFTFPLPFWRMCIALVLYRIYQYILKSNFVNGPVYSLYVSENEFTLRLYSIVYIVLLHYSCFFAI